MGALSFIAWGGGLKTRERRRRRRRRREMEYIFYS
jgi:hypothetical protein